LRQAGLVRGRAGRTGGYVLARQPEQITLRDVLEATSGPLCLMDCVDDPSACERTASCTSRQVWLAVTEDIRQVLARYTLCDLAKRPCSGCREAAESAREHRVERAAAPKRPKAAARRPRASRS